MKVSYQFIGGRLRARASFAPVAFDPDAEVTTNYFDGSLDMGTGLLGMHPGSQNVSTSALGYGVGLIRTHDATLGGGTPLYWYYIETSAAGYDYTKFDRLVSYCYNNDLKMVLTMYGTPTFYATAALSSVVDSADNHSGGAAMPTVAGLNAYTTVVRNLFTRANLSSGGLIPVDKQIIYAAEAWNEPNGWGGFWWGTATSATVAYPVIFENYAVLQNKMRTTINSWNSDNPSMPIELWGPTSDQEGGWNATSSAGSWQNRYMRHTNGTTLAYTELDRISLHPYEFHWLGSVDHAANTALEASSVWADVQSIQSNLSINRSLVMSEVGESLGASGLTATQMSAWYAQALFGNVVASRDAAVVPANAPIMIYYSHTGSPIGTPSGNAQERTALNSTHLASQGTLYRIDRMTDDAMRIYTSNGLFKFYNIEWT